MAKHPFPFIPARFWRESSVVAAKPRISSFVVRLMSCASAHTATQHATFKSQHFVSRWTLRLRAVKGDLNDFNGFRLSAESEANGNAVRSTEVQSQQDSEVPRVTANEKAAVISVYGVLV